MQEGYIRLNQLGKNTGLPIQVLGDALVCEAKPTTKVKLTTTEEHMLNAFGKHWAERQLHLMRMDTAIKALDAHVMEVQAREQPLRDELQAREQTIARLAVQLDNAKCKLQAYDNVLNEVTRALVEARLPWWKKLFRRV